MLRQILKFLPVLALSFASAARADHTSDDHSILGASGELVEAAQALLEVAIPVDDAFADKADALLDQAREFQTYARAAVDGLENHRDLDAEGEFREVEASFWSLAREWNANALAFSQDAGLRTSYTTLVDDYRELLFAVFDMH